jgi:TPR repeat protein
MYDKGKGVLYDYRVAAKFLRMAADQGNLDAQVYLGVKYNHGVRGEAVKADEEDYGSLA